MTDTFRRAAAIIGMAFVLALIAATFSSAGLTRAASSHTTITAGSTGDGPPWPTSTPQSVA